MTLHELAEERSIAYHAEIASRLRVDGDVLSIARGRVAGWARDRTVDAHYATAWSAILSSPLGELQAFLVDPGARARELRQVTPFAGLVEPRARWKIWRQVRERFSAAR